MKRNYLNQLECLPHDIKEGYVLYVIYII